LHLVEKYARFTVIREKQGIDLEGLKKRESRIRIKGIRDYFPLLYKLGLPTFILLYFRLLRRFYKRTLYIVNGRTIVFDHKSKKIQNHLRIEGDVKQEIRAISILNLLSVYSFIEYYTLYNKLKIHSFVEEFWFTIFFMSRLHAKYLFKYSEIKSLVCVDDLTPTICGYLSGAMEEEIRIGILRMSEERGRHLPFKKVSLLFIWNSLQLKEGINYSDKLSVLKRCKSELRLNNLRKKGKDLKIGIVTHSKLKESQLEKALDKLSTQFKSTNIYFRPHPGAFKKSSRWKTCKSINLNDPSSSSLEDFGRNIDLAICSLSSAMPILIEVGAPVVHLDTLDILIKENKHNFIMGYTQWIEEGYIYSLGNRRFDVKEVEAFYRSARWRAKYIKKDVPSSEKLISLTEAKRLLYLV